jgi:uncharacterized protein YaiE (UPF0345 family)
MAATFDESQKIDYLWKKIGYGVAKTAEPDVKAAFNEFIPSPLLYRGDLVWTESDQIPAPTPPAVSTSIVEVYKDGGGAYSPSVECTEDFTAPDNQTWTTNLTNWIPTQFGDNYIVEVYIAPSGITNPQTVGERLFQAGSGSDDTWFFDYQAGVLNFNGATIPAPIASGVEGKSVYIVGYRYVGLIGTSNLPGNINIGGLNFNGTTISSTDTDANIILSPNGNGIVQINSSLSSTANITADYFLGNGSQLTGISTISNGNSNVTVYENGNITFSSAGNANVAVITGTSIVASNITVSQNLIANTFQMGNGIYEFYLSSVYSATTTTTTPNQVLWSTNAANLSAIDFTIISTDEISNSRQTAKITAAILGTEVVFNEYSGLYFNGGVGSFSVIYQAGSPNTVQLVVTPDTANLTKYNMMITQYAD